MLLRLVPASEPIMPVFANNERAPTVSCMLMPNELATRPACESA